VSASSATPPGDRQLLERLARALESGAVTREDVERLLARGRRRPTPERPTTADALFALGAVVVFCGLAIAYGTVFEDLPRAAQITTPYLFPSVALGGCVWLSRRGSPRWQTDLAGLVGYAALGAAFGISGSASEWLDSGRRVAAAVAVAALVAAAVVGALHRATGSPLLLWVGMPAALAAFGVATTYLAGLWDTPTAGPERLGWVVLAEAGIAAAVAVVLARRHRPGCRHAAVWATVGGYAAVVLSGEDLVHFSVWHLILAGVVIIAFVAAAALDVGALTWIAAAGGALWVVMIAVVVGSATGAALAVVLAGIGLVGLGVLVARLRREHSGPVAMGRR